MCELDPGPAGGLLQVALVPVGHPVVTAHVSDLSGAAHAGAGLYLLLAVPQRHLDHLVVPASSLKSASTPPPCVSPGQREPAGHLLQLALAGVQLAVAATHGLAGGLLGAVHGTPRPVQFVQAERGRDLVYVAATVLPHHLTSVIVQFAIRATGEFTVTNRGLM